MLDESTVHYREVINNASKLMSEYFQKPVHFSKVIQLSEPDRRNLILRLMIENPSENIPKSLILKQVAIEKGIFETMSQDEEETEQDQLSRFAHDWAGLEFLTKIGNAHAPKFYAGNVEYKFILIEDLGIEHPSLVGPLTRKNIPTNQQEAIDALLSYMRRLGKMHADTAGKLDQFTTILENIYAQAHRYIRLPQSDCASALNLIKKLTGDESNELKNEVEDVISFSQEVNAFSVFLHGDICPDNVYYQNKQARFIDFEFGDFGNALIDGTYLRMHMPSCWCSKSFPDEIILQMETAYRDELKAKISSANDDAIYNKQLIYASAYWLIRTINQIEQMNLIDHEWICPSGPVDSDSKWEPEKNAFRPRILSRVKSFIRCSKETDHLPKLCEAASQLQSYLKKIWPETLEIDVFPVFKSKGIS